METEIAASQSIGFPILSALIVAPLLVVCALALSRRGRAAYWIGIAGALIEIGLSVLLVARFDRGVAGFQLAERVQLGELLSYHVAVDGISVFFVPLTALFTLLVTLYGQEVGKADPRRYLMAIFGLSSALIGAIVAVDLLLFWIFSALELIPGAYLIRGWGTGARKVEAFRKYLAFNILGVLLLLAAIVLVGRGHASIGAPPGAHYDLPTLLRAPLPESAQALPFVLFFFALAVRVPLFPFHGWLPIVMQEGPIVGVNVFLVGVKLGAYAFLRFVIPLLPDAAAHLAWLVTLAGILGMVYGALLALVQTDLRRLLAFACLSHMGAVMVGIFSLNSAGLTGGLLEMLNVGIAAAGLYFVAGFIHTRAGTAELSRLGLLAQRVPILSLTFLVIALAAIGMPGTSGFDAEHMVIEGALDAGHLPMAIAAGAGSLLAAAYLFRYYQRAFLGPSEPEEGSPPSDLRPRELIIAASIAGLIFGIGLFASPLEHAIDISLRPLAERAHHAREREREPSPDATQNARVDGGTTERYP